MNKLRIYEDRRFSDLTTFRIGGRIKYYAEVRNKDEICEVVSLAKKRKLEIFILGGGSDILVSDKDFAGFAIKYVGTAISYLGAGKIKAEAGAIWDDLVSFSVEKNLQGLECMSGIPGTVGASPVQNIGAYGQELKNSFLSLTAFDIDSEKFVEFDKSDCEFAYRDSFFKKKENWQKYIISDVTFQLKVGTGPQVSYDSLKNYLKERKIKDPTLLEVRKAVLTIRSGKFENPKDVGNAGSFFQNPAVDAKKMEVLRKKYSDMPCFDNGDGTYKCFAGWFIENSGWKGKVYKGAGVSPRHALILINPESKATAEDVYELSEKIINDVDKKFGVKLKREVQLINF